MAVGVAHQVGHYIIFIHMRHDVTIMFPDLLEFGSLLPCLKCLIVWMVLGL